MMDNDNIAQAVLPKIHVLFLHDKFKKRTQDRYFVDLALAVQESGHKVSVYTSHFDPKDCFEEINNKSGGVNVNYSGWWLPNGFKMLKAIVMAMRMIFFPPAPRAKVVILDIHPIALYLFSFFRSYKTIYVTNFNGLRTSDFYSKYMKITPTLVTAKTLKLANEILVQSEGMGEIFRRSFPSIRRELTILHPCLDTGLWCDPAIDITRIIPDIPKPNFLFACFGVYRKRSSFKLILDAFEELLMISATNIRNNIHLVIAGHCSDTFPEEKNYYYEILKYAKDKHIGSQVSFLTQLPTIHKKTLIEESIAVILSCKYDVFPDTILAVLKAGRPIIATKTGFANESLRHRMTGILVDPTPQMFAAAMFKILTNPAIQVFLSDMGHDLFNKNYSHNVFRRKINGLIVKYADNHPQSLNDN